MGTVLLTVWMLIALLALAAIGFWIIFAIVGFIVTLLNYRIERGYRLESAIRDIKGYFSDFFSSKGYIIFILSGVIYLVLFLTPWSSNWPLFENKEGYYYVNAFPDSDISKNYRIPARINNAINGISPPVIMYWNDYIMTDMYFPNGGYVSFPDYPALRLGEATSCLDNDGNRWTIEITQKRVTEKNGE